MSESKFIMAQKLVRVQTALMECELPDSLESLIPLIFKACLKENICFWFNFFEHEVVLNLRDIKHENYELNIRQYYESVNDIDSVKILVLNNAFLLTGNKTVFENNDDGSALQETETLEDAHIISGDKIIPKPIRNAIDTIKAKGVEVNKTSIRNHVPWNQLSNDQRIKCTNYLNEMGAS